MWKNLAFILHQSYKTFSGHWCTSDDTDIFASWFSSGGGNHREQWVRPESLQSYAEKTWTNSGSNPRPSPSDDYWLSALEHSAIRPNIKRSEELQIKFCIRQIIAGMQTNSAILPRHSHRYNQITVPYIILVPDMFSRHDLRYDYSLH